MVFRIKEGRANDVDHSGAVVIYMRGILQANFEELMSHGSEGGIYVSDNASPEQRKVLDTVVVQSIGDVLMKKVFGIKYVNIDVEDRGDTFHIKMPFGEVKQHLTRGPDGNPVRLENTTLSFLSTAKACDTPFWNYQDQGRHFDYENRCGTWADFMMAG